MTLIVKILTPVMVSQTSMRQCVGWYVCIVMVAITLSSADGMMKKAKNVPPPALPPGEWLMPNGKKGWWFKDHVDVDLINVNPGEGTLYKVLRAYKLARDKIEARVHGMTAVSKKKAPGAYYIPAADYQVLRMDAILVRDNDGSLRRLAFPVEMKASVDVSVKANTVKRYDVLIDLDSPFEGYAGEGPRWPHVGYEFTPLAGVKEDPIAGHLLIAANRPKEANNPCPRLLPDRHCIDENAFIPVEVPRISPERVLNGVGLFPNGATLNLWRVPMLEGAKDEHFTSQFYLTSTCHGYIAGPDMNNIPEKRVFV